MTPPHKTYRLQLIASATVLFLTGCAVGPDFKRPTSPESAGYSRQPESDPNAPNGIIGGGTQHFVSGADIAYDWWTDFKCPPLNKLVQDSLNSNPTIDVALASLHQAQELTNAQCGFFLPTVGANYTLQRQQLAGNLGGNSPGIQGDGSVISTYQNPGGPAPFNGPVTFNLHTAQLAISYTLDVFGQNRRQVESLDAQADQQKFLLQAARITLSSNVVSAAIQEASLRAQIDATQKLIDMNNDVLRIMRNQLAKGDASRLDVTSQESQLAQVVATMPPLRKQLAIQRDLITALAGKLPSQEPSETFDLASLHLPQNLPLSLPSMVIEQRPDVRAAEENIRSANAQVGVAIANRLPQFTLTGNAGGVASKFNEMFNPGGPFWSLIYEATQPIFDGNTLLHRQRAADQALLQTVAQYKSTVITAFQNIADTLNALEQDGNALKAAVDARDAASSTLELTKNQYQYGAANYLAVLSAEQGYQQAVIGLAQAQANRFADTAALYQALGGGWWNLPEPPKNSH